jgi:hypothetical protein
MKFNQADWWKSESAPWGQAEHMVTTGIRRQL